MCDGAGYEGGEGEGKDDEGSMHIGGPELGLVLDLRDGNVWADEQTRWAAAVFLVQGIGGGHGSADRVGSEADCYLEVGCQPSA